MFKLTKQSKKSVARLGKLKTPHGTIQTPFFMPIATKGSIKALEAREVGELSAQIILSNTYHLYLQPGLETLKKFKGLHNFMNWPGPILTDSGGYQVFSLSAKTRKGKSLRKISASGVEFQSFLDGSKHMFTPQKVQQIQDIIGSDIKMVLDVCSPYPCTKEQAEEDLKLTHVWATKALEYHQKSKSKNLLFGIVQGATYKDLRIKSAEYLSKLDFDGLAVGGLAVGESNQTMYQVLDYLIDYLPENKPRYLMGVGKPENIVEAVKRGVDMFDCVIPTREARHGRLYLWRGKGNLSSKNFYEVINITNSKYKNSIKKIDDRYTFGYLHHLFKAGEPLALKLATQNNIKFYLDLMDKIRQHIEQGKF